MNNRYAKIIKPVFPILRNVLLGLALLLNLLAFSYTIAAFRTNFRKLGPNLQIDFTVFYLSGQVLNHGLPLYDGESYHTVAEELFPGKSYSAYIYPPFFASLMRPMALLSLPEAILIWLGLNLVFLLLSLREACLLVGYNLPWWQLLPLAGLVVLIPPVYQTLLTYGQVNLLLLWWLLLALRLARPDAPKIHSIAAGVLLGLSVAIKLYMLPVAIYWWFFRRRLAAASSGLGLLVALVVSLLGAGWANMRSYGVDIFPKLVQVSNPFWVNYSLSATLERISHPVEFEIQFPFMPDRVVTYLTQGPLSPELVRWLNPIVLMLFVGSVIFFLTLDNLRWRGGGRLPHDAARLGILLCTLSLAIPLGWASTQVIAMLAGIVLISRRRYAWVWLSALLLAMHHLWPVFSYLFSPDLTLPWWFSTLGPTAILLLWIVSLQEAWQDNHALDRQVQPDGWATSPGIQKTSG